MTRVPDDSVSESSVIIQVMTALLYPFMVLYGFYIIINGRYTPGGGFQGGSILACLFIARYVVYPVNDLSGAYLRHIQRIFLSLILITPLLLLFSGFINQYPMWRPHYLTLMDCLIGIQVGFELGVVVLQFAFFKGVGKTWI